MRATQGILSSVVLPPGYRSPALLQLARYMLRPEPFFRKGRERFGTPFSANFAGYGDFVFLADPAAIKDVFAGDPDALHSGEGNAFMAETLGPSSLLVLDGAPHMRQRKALAPAFHGDRMRAHVETVVDATRRRMQTWTVGARLNLLDECVAITLDVILRAIFGAGEGLRLGRFEASIRAYMAMTTSRFALLSPLLPRWLPQWQMIKRKQTVIDAEIASFLSARRAEDASGDDVLADLLRMTHEDGQPLSDGELRDHLFTLTLAGHDTTAVSLAWAFDQLLPRADVVDRIRAELAEVVGDAPLTAEQLPRLTYLDAAIRESLRIRPLLPFVIRRLTRDFEAGGTTYPEGTHLCPCMLLVHSDPALYPEPATFEPERFGGDRKPDAFSWFPFGGGTRRCIGMSFALLEMRVVLATVLREATLTFPRRRRCRVVRRGLVLAPSDGASATLEARRS